MKLWSNLKVFLLYHTCTNSTSNIATNISHFTIFIFSVKKWIWHRSSHCCMQSPNFSNSFLHKEKASCKSLWNPLISNCWTMSKTIWTAILPASQPRSLYVATNKFKELVTRPIGKIISAVLKVSKNRHTVFLSLIGQYVCCTCSYGTWYFFVQ